jgi:cell wall-associated NlpC family hydrolase
MTAGFILVVAVATPRPSSASPIDDKRAEAARISAQIERLGNQESALAERYNRAVLESRRAADAQATAAAQFRATQQNADRAKGQLREVAVQAYIQGPSAAPTMSRVAGGSDPARAQYYTGSLSRTRADSLDALRAATLQLNEQKSHLDAAKQQADAGLRQVDASRRQVLQAQAALNSTLGKVKGDLASLVAQADAARRAADAARARTLVASPSRSRSASSRALPPGPAARQSAGVAVAEALRQVGKPYQYGGAGPDSFDCSGLTMWAWRAAGVSLSHYTGAQYSETTHIPLSDLQPGDLVFRPDMGHVGMYIGNGNMVEAPHTGANVRVVPLRSDMTVASRP